MMLRSEIGASGARQSETWQIAVDRCPVSGVGLALVLGTAARPEHRVLANVKLLNSLVGLHLAADQHGRESGGQPDPRELEEPAPADSLGLLLNGLRQLGIS